MLRLGEGELVKTIRLVMLGKGTMSQARAWGDDSVSKMLAI